MTAFPRRTAARSLLLAALLAAAAATLSACAPVVVGAAAGGTALVATDRRTAGVQLEDQNIALKVESNMRRHFGDKAKVSAAVYQTVVLLVGDIADEASKQQAGTLAGKVENVSRVVNQLTVGPVATGDIVRNDIWVNSKVRAALVNTRGVPSRTIVVTTHRGTVYLMGKVTRLEGDYAAAAAANVSGVQRVVKLFEIMSPEEERALLEAGKNPEPQKKAAPITTPGNDQAPAGSGSSSGANVEVMPIQ
ncbi:BON domain-containing protein [Orrella sp. JC864]|uniref:BON domain-containing protein n=1 Tax=Orrella sp. JC864 TaxID=3120298 RepID=UPI0012BC4101